MKKIMQVLIIIVLSLNSLALFSQEGVIIPQDKKSLEDLFDPDNKETPTLEEIEISTEAETSYILFGTDQDIIRRINEILNTKELPFDDETEKNDFIKNVLEKLKSMKINSLNKIPTRNEINKVIEDLLSEIIEEKKAEEKEVEEALKNAPVKTKKLNDKVTIRHKAIGGWIPSIYLADEWAKGVQINKGDSIPVTILIRTTKENVKGDIDVFVENLETGEKTLIYSQNDFIIERKFIQLNFDWDGTKFHSDEMLPDGEYKVFCEVDLYSTKGKKFGEIIRYWGLFFDGYTVIIGEGRKTKEIVKDLNKVNGDKDLEFDIIETNDGVVINLGEIFFDFSSTKLKDGMEEKLEELSIVIKKYEDYKINIEGHTDNIGSEEINQEYSEERAKVVEEYLIKNGIKKSRIKTKGWGYKKPATTNKTTEGRALNRRVEIILIKEEE